MNTYSVYVGRLFGIPVRIHVTWLAAFALISVGLGGAYYPQSYPGWTPGLYWLMGMATSLLFFASILLHEAAHCLVAGRRGMTVQDIVLFAFGGVSEMRQEPPSPGTELLMAVAGPSASLVLGSAIAVLWWFSLDLGEPITAILGYLGGVNLTVGLFNLLPGFPLDGGRVLRALLWWRRRSLEWATRWASRLGQAFAGGLLLIGVWVMARGSVVDGAWFCLIGLFLDRAAAASYRQLLADPAALARPAGEVAQSSPPLAHSGALKDIGDPHILPDLGRSAPDPYPSVALLARFQGWSTSQPRRTAM